MEIVTGIKDMQKCSEKYKKEGISIAFVPTMGYFHDAHMMLFEEGKKRGDVLVASVFVNNLQFGKGEDYATYPRDLNKDSAMARKAGVDILFVPDMSEMYPSGFETYVTVEEVTKNLCGIFRPDHFRGVTTVVVKLFNIVMPNTAVFGEKDYQQLITIKKLVDNLNFDIDIVSIPIIREEDGLALSSRNAYLTPSERSAAPLIYKALKEGEKAFQRGERNAEIIIKAVKEVLDKEPIIKPEYLKVCNSDTLKDIDRIEDKCLLALAARIGKARLIDNIMLR